jgi:hypothetical protein
VVTPVGAAPAAVPLQITSHGTNAAIDAGATTVHGRPAPGALVDVKVVGIPPFTGMFGATQNVLQQRVQADGNGKLFLQFLAAAALAWNPLRNQHGVHQAQPEGRFDAGAVPEAGLRAYLRIADK